MVLILLNILSNEINPNIIYCLKYCDKQLNSCNFHLTETELSIVEVIYYRFNIMYTTRHLDFVKLHLTTRIIWALNILPYHSCLCNY